jgi:GT2 family glycosyltransferase
MKKRDKVGFLILHYCTIKETINCINSIKEKIDIDDYEIVVVDNNSLNGTGNQLLKKYRNDNKVTVLINDENLGFARGNNVGFKYLKEQLNCNYIVMLNNDVLLISDNIYYEAKKEYDKTKFAVMGPKIYDKNGNLAIVGNMINDRKKVLMNIMALYVLLILSYCRILKLFIKLKKKKSKQFTTNDGIRKKNILLHGCCLIFSPLYIEKFDGIDSRTFLYGEEELLYIRLRKNNMLGLYNPNIVIKHLEDVATNASEKDFYKKKIRMYSNLIHSNKILLKELNNV